MKSVKIEIKWALIFSVAMLLWMVLEKLFGLHDKHLDMHYYLTNLFAIPAVWIYVLALKDKKKRFYSGRMSYKQGVVSGIALTLFVVVLYPLVQWTISNVITPDYFANVIQFSVEGGHFGTVEEAESFFNLENYIITGALSALVMGICTTLVIMVFLRSKKSQDIVE